MGMGDKTQYRLNKVRLVIHEGVWIAMTEDQADRWCGAHASDYHDYWTFWVDESAPYHDGRRSIKVTSKDARLAVDLFGSEVLL